MGDIYLVKFTCSCGHTMVIKTDGSRSKCRACGLRCWVDIKDGNYIPMVTGPDDVIVVHSKNGSIPSIEWL